MRETWRGSTSFILAAAGSAVGLGNIWRFPYLAAKYGGGAFLIGYLLIVFVIIKTMLLSEILIGRAAHKTSVGAFSSLRNKRWKIVGFLGILSAFMILSFYSVVSGWVTYYTVQMAFGNLNHLDANALGSFFVHFSGGLVTPIVYHAIFMFILVLISIRGVVGGIEKLSRYGMPVLFLLMAILAVRSLSLPNAHVGLTFYLVPQWSQLTNPDLWSAALGQAFFSMSLASGCMLAYGSYLSKKENLPKVSSIVSYVDTLAAFFAGLIILPALFAFSGFHNIAGPGLVFIVLPAIFGQMWGGQFFGTLFFLLVIFASITSAISLLEVVVSYGIEQRGYSRKKSTIIFASLTFIVGIGCSYSLGPWSQITIAHIFHVATNVKIFNMGLFDLLAYISSNILMPLGGILIAIFVGWIRPARLLKEVTNNGTINFWWQPYFVVATKFIIPLVVGYILLSSLGILHSGYN